MKNHRSYSPAAIYLGGTGQTVVRAINSAVIDLFNRAENSGNGGDDQGDGGFTRTSLNLGSGDNSLKVILSPGNARWTYHQGTQSETFNSGQTKTGIIAPTSQVSFSDVTGLYLTPGPRTITIFTASDPAPNAVTATITYNGIPSSQPGLQDRPVPTFENTTFTVSTSGNTPTLHQWLRNGVPLTNGINANETTISGATTSSLSLSRVKPADAGSYSVTVTWLTRSLTSSPATLTVSPATQTISFTPLASRVLDDGPFTVTATASSGLPVSYQLFSGPATLAGNTVTPTGLGPVIMSATQAGDGIYGAAATAFQLIQITGDTPNSWRARFFTSAEQLDPLSSGPSADPGRDGVNVLLAYALNLNPKANDSRLMTPGTGTFGLPAASRQNVSGQPRLALEFVRRKATSTPGITYRVEFTSNLPNATSWSPTGTETAVTSIDSTWERVVVTDSQPATPARFGRLQISSP